MTTPEPDRILSTLPMTTDDRWPPGPLLPCPVTHPRTNVTARSRLPSTPLSKSTFRGFSNGSKPKESHCPTSSTRSSRRTSNAGASNTDSSGSSVMPAGMRNWWRSVASAGDSVQAVARDAWRIPPPTSSSMCCQSDQSVSGCCRSPTHYGSSSRPVCGGMLRVIACIETPEVIERILVHLATRESGGINDPRAPPLGACAAQPRPPLH